MLLTKANNFKCLYIFAESQKGAGYALLRERHSVGIREAKEPNL